MGETTGIEWANASWNPWMGCHKVSAGCKNCYMFRDMPHYGRDPNTVVRTKTTFDAPLKWAKSGKVAAGARVFTCSWSDWFIAEADPWRDEAWDIVRRTPQYTYLILTKRPERIEWNLPDDWNDGYPNVWLGVSAENQEQANKRIPALLNTPAAIRFVSAEPLLGPISFERWMGEMDCGACRVRFGGDTCPECDTQDGDGMGQIGFAVSNVDPYAELHWVITGGESALKDARYCDLDWVRAIRDQCQAVGVALFHKQHGGTRKIDGVWGGRELDGRTWDEFPGTPPALSCAEQHQREQEERGQLYYPQRPA